jgi:CDP-diglyceride synthetase
MTELLLLASPLAVLFIYGLGSGWRLDNTIAVVIVVVCTTVTIQTVNIWEWYQMRKSKHSNLQYYVGLPCGILSVMATTYLSVRNAIASTEYVPWHNPFLHALASAALVRSVNFRIHA